MKLIKNIFYSTCVAFLSIELFTRIFIFFLTFNSSIFLYGINKTVSFNVIDLSELKFAVISEKKNHKIPKVIKTLEDKIVIWTFGGSTTEGFEPNCGHSTSSWPLELEKLDSRIEVINFAKKGSTSNYAIQQYFKSRTIKENPHIILWANKINEESNAMQIKSNTFSIFFLKLYKTLKSNFVIFYLYDNFIKKINKHVLKKTDEYPKTGLLEFWNEAIQNYKHNTKLAINLSTEDRSEFYIVSLFAEYNFKTKKFLRKEFFNLWENSAEELSEKYQIEYIDTEKLIRENIEYLNHNKQYFCKEDGPNIHQTLLGNQVTAKLIYEYIFD